LGRIESRRASRWRIAKYGLLGVREGDDPGQLPTAARTTSRTLTDARPAAPKKMKLHGPIMERVEQGIYLFFHCGLLTLVLYYELTVYDDPTATPFEYLMDSQGFGVRMFFTSLGVAVSFMWESLFSS